MSSSRLSRRKSFTRSSTALLAPLFDGVTGSKKWVRDSTCRVCRDHLNNETIQPRLQKDLDTKRVLKKATRWALEIRACGDNYEYMHIPGKDNIAADFLSRLAPGAIAARSEFEKRILEGTPVRELIYEYYGVDLVPREVIDKFCRRAYCRCKKTQNAKSYRT
ncbi:unnamed protein product [Amoebophrya sp. A25]|nr:unnamed protein product [Amoebophrya sp. A25]|eukprot:GSA25T00014727001.1